MVLVTRFFNEDKAKLLFQLIADPRYEQRCLVITSNSEFIKKCESKKTIFIPTVAINIIVHKRSVLLFPQ